MPNRRTWADGPNGKTPINATRLNALETDLTLALDGSVTPDPDNPGFYLIGAPTNG